MPSPWKHPENGRYYYRRRVPNDLVELVGYSHEKHSLKTTDPAEAKRRYEEIHIQIEERWKNLRRGYRRLDLIELASIGGDMYDRYLKLAKEADGVSLHYFYHVGGICSSIVDGTIDPFVKKDWFDNTIGLEIDTYLSERGLIVDPKARRAIEWHVAKAIAQAAARPFHWFSGDYREDPEAGRFPGRTILRPVVRIRETFDHYAKEADLSAATRKRWTPVFLDLAEFVGHDDLAKIDADKIAAWLDHLQNGKRKAVTVRDVYLASVKALYGWLVVRRQLKDNPTRDLKVKVPGHERYMREFTDEEACRILSASLAEQPLDLPPNLRSARRWVPWICAYTGARVNEVTQLRREDILYDDGVWILHVTPDAGRVKDRKRRKIPLHPHLVRQGFLQFVAGCPDGPMFYFSDSVTDPTASPAEREARTAKRFTRTGEHIASWVRSLGIADKDVGPSHAWRHRFKTEGRRAGMKERILDVIQGHAPRSKGENYGSFPPSVLLQEMLKLVSYTVEGGKVSVVGAPVYIYDHGSLEAANAAEALKARRGVDMTADR